MNTHTHPSSQVNVCVVPKHWLVDFLSRVRARQWRTTFLKLCTASQLLFPCTGSFSRLFSSLLRLLPQHSLTSCLCISLCRALHQSCSVKGPFSIFSLLVSALLVSPMQRHWDMNNIRKKQHCSPSDKQAVPCVVRWQRAKKSDGGERICKVLQTNSCQREPRLPRAKKRLTDGFCDCSARILDWRHRLCVSLDKLYRQISKWIGSNGWICSQELKARASQAKNQLAIRHWFGAVINSGFPVRASFSRAWLFFKEDEVFKSRSAH